MADEAQRTPPEDPQDAGLAASVATSRVARRALEQMLPTLIHALRTPLSGLAMGIEVAALRLRQHGDAGAFLQPMRETMGEMTRTLDQLVAYVRQSHAKHERVETEPFFAQLVHAWVSEHPQAQVQWRAVGAVYNLTSFDLDSRAAGQAVKHLLDNAYEAAAASVIRVVLQQTGQNTICLSVSDEGGPMTADVQARMTEPFFTTKHRQLGLGLAFAQHVALMHQGALSIDNDKHGTTVALILKANAAGLHVAQPLAQ